MQKEKEGPTIGVAKTNTLSIMIRHDSAKLLAQETRTPLYTHYTHPIIPIHEKRPLPSVGYSNVKLSAIPLQKAEMALTRRLQ